MGGPDDADEKTPKTTAVVPQRRSFLPSLHVYKQPTKGAPVLPIRVSCFEVLKKAGIEPWGWFSNFADEAFTFLGRPFTGGVHNDLAKQLRADEAALIEVAKKKKGEGGGADENEGDAADDDGQDEGADEGEEDEGDDDEEEEDTDDEDEDQQDDEELGNDSKLTKSDAFEAGTTLGMAGPPKYPRGIKIRGARKVPTKARLSMHFFGLAMDIDYDFNHYPETQGRLAINTVLAKARLLLDPTLEPQEKPAVPWGWPIKKIKTDKKTGKVTVIFKHLKHSEFFKVNEKLKAYFALIQNVDALAPLLAAATAEPWKGLTVEEASELIDKDLTHLHASTRGTLNKKEQQKWHELVKKNGLMNITLELRNGIGLDWGGAYGDLMHFDARNLAGDPKKIHDGIEAFAKDKKLQKELGAKWAPLKGQDEAVLLEQLLQDFPKPSG